MNRAGYSLLTLVTGKEVNIPCLTMNTVASESTMDADAVRRIIERVISLRMIYKEQKFTMKLEKTM